RMIDRPIRPMFPKDMRNDVSVVVTVLSTDIDNAPEIAGFIAASIAIGISDIPFREPIAAVSVGLVDGEIVLNPMTAQRAKSDLDLTVAGSAEKIVMIEAGANEIDNETMLKAIAAGHEEIKKMVAFIAGIQAEIGKPKFAFESKEVPHDLLDAVLEEFGDQFKYALDTDDKNIREERLLPITDAIHAKYDEQYADQPTLLGEVIYKAQKVIVRRWLLDEQKRVDGRGMDQMRPLSAEVNLLPRVHGSGLFTRGQTQVLTVATLGSISDAQMLDSIDEDEEKRYMHQYNFPSYSVGETRPSRGPGRREIGHGALAERALVPVLPSVEEFPYAMRLVSEVLSSNGSTSQASICGSTLALMDAGVPIKAPVAGISCGLITEGDRWMTMVDIQGLEDFYGDMDFKVGGTHKGITAIQVDIKIDGLTLDIIADAFEKTKKARDYIIDEVILKAIPAPRNHVSKYAPKQKSTVIAVDKIRDVIGSGGKVIQKICAECDVKIDINEDGHVFILGIDQENVDRAMYIVETIAKDPEVGAIYKGKVTRLMNFGAFVEIAPGKEGLVHISKLENHRVEKVEDVVSVGDEVYVKVTEIDDQGRINLSRKDAMNDLARRSNG
ncbi:MAG: polyribonucleotide nucleotidyltransferase, partial [Candidatus Merdivicinus sp.]